MSSAAAPGLAPPTERAAQAVRPNVLTRSVQVPPRIGSRLWGSLVHVLHGATICAVVFPGLDDAARRHHVTQWTREMLEVLGIRLVVSGTAASGRVLLRANHVSWLDILAI